VAACKKIALEEHFLAGLRGIEWVILGLDG
jgi:hypothetical protein